MAQEAKEGGGVGDEVQADLQLLGGEGEPIADGVRRVSAFTLIPLNIHRSEAGASGLAEGVQVREHLCSQVVPLLWEVSRYGAQRRLERTCVMCVGGV